MSTFWWSCIQVSSRGGVKRRTSRRGSSCSVKLFLNLTWTEQIWPEGLHESIWSSNFLFWFQVHHLTALWCWSMRCFISVALVCTSQENHLLCQACLCHALQSCDLSCSPETCPCQPKPGPEGDHPSAVAGRAWGWTLPFLGWKQNRRIWMQRGMA